MLALIGGAPLWRFRLGAGPAVYSTPAGGSAGTSVASTSERVIRPGGVLDARVDLLRLGPVVTELRGQLRAFAPVTVTTGSGARYELGYWSLVLAAGIGLQR